MNSLVRAITLAISVLLFACSDADNSLFDENDSIFIEVSCEMTKSFESSGARVKSDTVRTGDSVIFIANILPSKSIKMKQYHWTLDGEFYSNEFSFKDAIETPGIHKISFMLETYLEDTLSDTLTLCVSSIPFLDTNKFIPKDGSKNIPFTGGISFAWDGYDIDSLARIFYNFKIDGIIDTIIDSAHLTYWGTLPPLKRFHWEVSAINEFGIKATDTLKADFYTGGADGENAVDGFIRTGFTDSRQNAYIIPIALTILDTLNSIVASDTITMNSEQTTEFNIGPLESSKYKFIVNSPKYGELWTDTISLQLRNGDVFTIDTIILSDTTKPTIEFIGKQSGKDSLAFEDSLKFLIHDKGSPIRENSVKAYLESKAITSTKLSGDTFSIILPQRTSFVSRPLDIIATDAGKNTQKMSYTLLPSEYFIETNEDTTITIGDYINLFIVDKNPYGYVPQFFLFDAFDGKNILEFEANGSTDYYYLMNLEPFQDKTQRIRLGILYENGFTYWKSFILRIEKEDGGNND